MRTPTVAVVGYSDSGKTRVAEFLVAWLTRRGYRVGAIKHAVHGHQADRPGSDSYRLFQAGAVAVVVSSPDRLSEFHRRDADTPLEALVERLSGECQVVVAEGYRSSLAPKVLVGDEAPSPLPDNVVAVVGKARVDGAPRFDLDALEPLAHHVEGLLLRQREEAPRAVLRVNGEEVPLGPFPARVLEGVLRGFLASLKGTPSEVREIQVELRTG